MIFIVIVIVIVIHTLLDHFLFSNSDIDCDIDSDKGCSKKTLVLNFCFAHISASIHRIFKILVPTPHN